MVNRMITRSKDGASPVSIKFSVGEEDQWKQIKCPICMEHPHNAVLLLCSSYRNGCRPFICNTSSRHSNCFDQYCSTFKSSPLFTPFNNNNNMINSTEHHYGATSWVDEDEDLEHQVPNTVVDGNDKHHITCPLCRGSVLGKEVVEPIRRYLNTKPRECSSEDCGFIGTYDDLRKHAWSNHPFVRPAQAQPERQQAWDQMEQEEEEEEGLTVGNDFVLTLCLTMSDEEEVEVRIQMPRALLSHELNYYNQTIVVGNVISNINIDRSSCDDSMVTLNATLLNREDAHEVQIDIPRELLAPKNCYNQMDIHIAHVTNIDTNIDGPEGMHGDNEAERGDQNFERDLHAKQDIDFSWGRDRSNGFNQARSSTTRPRVCWNSKQRWNQNSRRNINGRGDANFSRAPNLSNNRAHAGNQTCWNARRRRSRSFERNLNVRRDFNFSSSSSNRSHRALLFPTRHRCANVSNNPTLASCMADIGSLTTYQTCDWPISKCMNLA